MDVLNAKMLKLKRAHNHDKKAVLQVWDWRYYDNQLRRRSYALDADDGAAYFPPTRCSTGCSRSTATCSGSVRPRRGPSVDPACAA